MAVLGLGYAGFGSDALEDWRQFGTSLVGLQAVERGNSLLAFSTVTVHPRGNWRQLPPYGNTPSRCAERCVAGSNRACAQRRPASTARCNVWNFTVAACCGVSDPVRGWMRAGRTDVLLQYDYKKIVATPPSRSSGCYRLAERDP